MKVAIDISSLESGHQFRGIGFYTKALLAALQEYAATDHTFRLLPFKYNQFPEADLYHFPAFSPFFWSLPFFKLSQCILTIHDLIPIQYPKHFPLGIRGSLIWQAQKRLLPWARHIITDSEASKQVIHKLTSISLNHITSVALAAEAQYTVIQNDAKRRAIRQKYQLPNKFILYIGDVNWHKNIGLLSKICLKLNYPLVVVGKQAMANNIDHSHPWNQELSRLQYVAKKYPNLIIRTGFIPTEDVVLLLNEATCLALPSIEEGFGLTIIEAMQSGCPVLTSNRSSCKEVAGDAALLIDPFSASSLEKGLKQIWTDANLRKQLSNTGLQRAKSFSWQKTAQATVEVYKRVL